MFKYICMPKLVAFYLREFSMTEYGAPSMLYRFVFCLCLPFVSQKFRVARLKALAVAECTNSEDQIARVLAAVTGASVAITTINDDYLTAYNGSDDVPDFPYDNSLGADNALVPFVQTANTVVLTVTLNGAQKSEVDAYLPLLIPFYVEIKIIYLN